MERRAGERHPAASIGTEDFSLVLGGPLYRLLLKMRLARPPLRLLRRRMLAIVALAWLPLLLLSIAEGSAVSGVTIPFLSDVEAYARFLVALPLLLFADVILHRRLAEVVAQFRRSQVVSADVVPRFEEAVASAVRLRDSALVEFAILAIVFVAAPLAWHYAPALPASTWYANVQAGRVDLTRAGWWFVHASVPLSQFMILRLYFRLYIWGRFLWQVSRLPLHLTPAHPDRAGGLGFLQDSVAGFVPLLLAQAITVSGFIASRVLFDGRNVLDFRIELVALAVTLLVVVLLPLSLFTMRLIETRRTALSGYGGLASSYVHEFDRKWLQGEAPRDEALLGSADIQSLADLAGSYDIVRGMRPMPFDTRVVIQVLAAIVLPFLPLVFTVFSLPELLRRLVQVLL
ncbi:MULTISPECIES: hypothetical protein [unclassified Luteimonas]